MVMVRFSGVWADHGNFRLYQGPRIDAGRWDIQRRQTKLTQVLAVLVRIANLSPFDYSKFGNNLTSG